MLKRVENGKEIAVNNQDIIALQRIFYAMQDVCTSERMCQWAEERLQSITQHLSDSPGGGERKGLDDGIAAMEEAKETYRGRLKQHQAELHKAEEILAGIKNPNMRTFVVLTYVLMLPGDEVRKRLNMTKYALKNARRIVEKAENMASVKWVDKYTVAEK